MLGRKYMTSNMTTGSPRKLIGKFIVPLIIGNIFQQLYNWVDTVIVGHYVGIEALAAVGACGSIMFLVFGFVMGLTTGFTVPLAQTFGAGDEEGVRKNAGNALILSLIFMTIITAVSLLTARGLLKLMNTPSDIFEYSYSYLTIIYWGILCAAFYNLMASILRAIGNSNVPLYSLVLSALLNIVLDLLFILKLGMGVAGAALRPASAWPTTSIRSGSTRSAQVARAAEARSRPRRRSSPLRPVNTISAQKSSAR